jgi:hypothetical protein
LPEKKMETGGWTFEVENAYITDLAALNMIIWAL